MRNIYQSLTLPLIFLSLVACSSGGGDDGGSESASSGAGSSSSGVTSSSSSSSGTLEPQEPVIPTASNPVLSFAAITDARGLIITDDNGEVQKPRYSKLVNTMQLQAAEESFDGTFAPQRLYKVTVDGDIVEVELTSTDQSSLRGLLTPTRITTMGNNWVLLYFDTNYEYVQRGRNWDEGGGAYVYDYSLQMYENLTKAYLVNQSTGAAYEAPWATESLVIDDGDDGFIDYGYTNENNEWIEQTDSVQKAFTWLSSPDDYLSSTPAAYFDNEGDMYVIGLVTDENGYSSEDGGNPYSSYGRVLKVSTSDSGASSITAEVIQAVDLDAQVLANSLVVSADGQIVVYASQDWEGAQTAQTRVLNLRDSATYSLSAILGTSEYSAVLRGLEGNLYVGMDENLIGTLTASDWYYEFSAPILGRLALEQGNPRPVFENMVVINGGRELTSTNGNDISAVVPTFEQWQALPGLLEQGNSISINNITAWYEENLGSLAAGLNVVDGAWQLLPYSVGSRKEMAVLSGRQVLLEVLFDDKPQRIYSFDLAEGTAQGFDAEHFGFSDFVSYGINSESLFLFGEDSNLSLDRLVRWSPLSDSEVDLIDIDIDTFDVKRFKVLNNNSVLLEASVLNPYSDGETTLSSGSKILAEASFDGSISIIDTIDSAEAQILVMERVTPGDFITVDGNAQDWSLEYRSGSDAEGDTVNEALGDITFLSQLSDDEYRWLLVELAGSLGQTRLVVTLSGDTSITVQNSNGSWVVAQSSSDLFSVGAIFARGASAVEFRVPSELVAELALDGGSYPSVRTEIDRVFGDVTLTSDAVNASLGMIELELELSRPVGPTTVTVDLGDGYSLTIADTNWNPRDAEVSDGVFEIALMDVSNGDSQSALSNLGGNYTVVSNEQETLELMLPISVLGMFLDGEMTVVSESVDVNSGDVSMVLAVPESFSASSLSGFVHDGSDSVIEISNLQGNNFDVALIGEAGSTEWSVAGGTASFDSAAGELTLIISSTVLGFETIPASVNVTVASNDDLSATVLSDTVGAVITSSPSMVTIPVDELE